MERKTRMNRRTFLTAAGTAVAGAGSASTASLPTVRARAGIPYQPDVLVVGGGPAGIGAALGAARIGAKTLLIESCGFFGGVAAWSLGMPINQMRPESKPRSQIHELLIRKLLAYGDQAVFIGQHQLYCNVDYLKVAVLDALDEVGCKYLAHLSAVDALVEGNRITGVVVGTKRGLATIRAKVVVDCTGDADVAYFAGAETMMETKEPRMPSTLLLNLGLRVSPRGDEGANEAACQQRPSHVHLRVRPVVRLLHADLFISLPESQPGGGEHNLDIRGNLGGWVSLHPCAAAGDEGQGPGRDRAASDGLTLARPSPH